MKTIKTRIIFFAIALIYNLNIGLYPKFCVNAEMR